MAITVNGFIGKEDGNSDWTSPEDGKSFIASCQKAGTVIMGRKTYDVLAPNNLPLTEGLHVVLTHNQSLKSDNKTVVFRNQTPKQTCEWLEKNGCQEAVVIGGSQTSSEFIQEGLIDEIYLDVEPLVFGKGMLLFEPAKFELKLRLLETKMLSPQTIQLHYKVIK